MCSRSKTSVHASVTRESAGTNLDLRRTRMNTISHKANIENITIQAYSEYPQIQG